MITTQDEDHAPALPPPPEGAPPPAARESDDVCWCCAGATLKRHCKIVCTNCGFMRDCSDP